MTPTQFRIVKHVTAAAFAVAMAGLFVLGVDGVIAAVQKLTHVVASAPPAPPAAIPAVETPADPGVVSTFIVPPDDDAADASAGRGRE